MADSSGFTPASYDQYVQGVLQDTGTLLAPPKTKAPAAQDASLKAQTGPYDTYIGDTLKDVDALLAPPKAGPKDSVAPEGGPVDTLIGGAEGAWNTVKGLVTGVAGQAAGVLDIPLHAAGISHTDPESVEQGVAGFGDLTPGTRRGERTSEAVQEGAGDILGAGGRTASLAARIAGKAPAGPDTSFGAGFQSRFGIPVPGVTKDNPEGIVEQSPEEQAKIEGMVNSALLPALGGKPEARSVPLEEPTEPPPPPGAPPGSPPGGPEYTAPEVNKKTKDDDDDDDGGGGGPRKNRRQSGLPDEVRKVYDGLTAQEKEDTPLKDGQTGLFDRSMYDRINAGDRPQVFFDLRDLKQANDVHGHSYGDAVIKAFGDAAKAAGVSGQMFRYGGDEFSMLVDGPEGLAQARKLQQALQGATVEAILPDGTKITTKGIDADYGYGKNKDAADQAAYAAKRANKAAPSDAQAGGERPSVGRAPSQGDAVQGQPGQQQHPDLSRRFAGTQSSTHTPYPEGSPPGDYVLGKIRLKQGDRDVVVPVKTEFETPGDEELYKVGEQVLKTWGEDKEPRPNTASPSERELLMRMRQYLAKEDPAWRQNDDRANLAYARAFAREVRDLHQRGYNVLRDHLEENFPDNPKGELRANPHKYAFSTKVPKWQPRDLVTKCF